MADWIVGFIEQFGYVGIAALMLVENIFPPIPSELIMPFAGFVSARGELHPAGVVAAGVLGSLAGTLPWYWAGRAVGSERLKEWAGRHGRWLTLSPEQVEQSERWFASHGHHAVLLGRLVPAVRTVVSMPAGIARMPLPAFLLWSLLGTSIWTSVLAGAGYLLESRFQLVSSWLNPVSTAIVAGCLLVYLYRVATFRKRR